jgi:hypothetical protein
VGEIGAALLRALGTDPADAPSIANAAAALIPDWENQVPTASSAIS